MLGSSDGLNQQILGIQVRLFRYAGANMKKTEVVMTAPGEFALGLGLEVDVSSAARVKLKSRPLLRNSGQKC